MPVDTMGREIKARPSRIQSDPAPAIYLRDLLARRRRRGERWSDDEFDRLAGVVVRDLKLEDQDDWLAVFSSHRDPVWRPAYERTLRGRVPLAVLAD